MSNKRKEEKEGIMSVEEITTNEDRVLDYLLDREGEAVSKDKIVEDLEGIRARDVKSMTPDLFSLTFHKISRSMYGGEHYYYAEVDESKVFFVVSMGVVSIITAIFMAVEYGLI